MKRKFLLLGLVTGSTLLGSCTDEFFIYEDRKGEDQIEVITDQSQNKILSYKVTNPGEKHAIYSAIDHEAKTITVYLPAYYQLQFMEVAIELPEGTTVSPSSEELVPVFSDTPFIYKVSASNGTTAEYKVQVVIQQAALELKEISSTEATETVYLSGIVTIEGANILPSSAVTKLFLTDASGKKIWGFTMNEENSNSSAVWFAANNQLSEEYKNLDTSKDYWLQVESYSLTARMQHPVKIQL